MGIKVLSGKVPSRQKAFVRRVLFLRMLLILLFVFTLAAAGQAASDDLSINEWSGALAGDCGGAATCQGPLVDGPTIYVGEGDISNGLNRQIELSVQPTAKICSTILVDVGLYRNGVQVNSFSIHSLNNIAIGSVYKESGYGAGRYDVKFGVGVSQGPVDYGIEGLYCVAANFPYITADEFRAAWDLKVTLRWIAGASLMAGIAPGAPEAALSEEFSVAVAIRNDSDDPVSNVRPAGSLEVIVVQPSGVPASQLVELVNGPRPEALAQIMSGQQEQFNYTYRAKREGKVRFRFPGATGVGSGGKTVSTPGNIITESDIVTIKQKKYLSLELDPFSVPGNSTLSGAVRSHSVGTVTVKDSSGKPLANQNVEINMPFFVDASGRDPRLLICDDTGRRVYPSGENSGSKAFRRQTDSEGRFQFHIVLGTDIGNGSPGSLGAGLGNLEIDAFLTEYSGSADEHAADTIQPTGQAANGIPTGFIAVLQNAFTQDLQSGSGSNVVPGVGVRGPIGDLQQRTLAWLREKRVKSPLLANVDFGPIQASDQQHAGIVFYPASRWEPVAAFLERGEPLPSDYLALVMPLDPIGVSGNGFATFNKMISLQQWEYTEQVFGEEDDYNFPTVPTEPIERAEAVPGLLGSDPNNQPPAYFGYPYPLAPSEEPELSRYSRCLVTDVNQQVISVHSPVQLLLTDRDGNRLGSSEKGETLAEIAGGFYTAAAQGLPAAFSLPLGEYQVAVAGTGKGKAVLSFLAPGEEGLEPHFFRFQAKPGVWGELHFSPDGSEQSFKFGAKQVRANSTLKLVVKKLPRKLRESKRQKQFKITVLNEFKGGVLGAVVDVYGKGYETSAVANGAGVAVLQLSAPSSGKKLVVAVYAPGFEPFKKKIKIIRKKSKKKKKKR